MIKPITASEAIQLLADEAGKRGATADDANHIVRYLVQEALPGRPAAQFSAWLCVCCELADRAAQRDGFLNQVQRALAACTQPQGSAS